MTSSVVTDNVESQHRVFPMAALLVWLHHASASVVSRGRSVFCGLELKSGGNVMFGAGIGEERKMGVKGKEKQA